MYAALLNRNGLAELLLRKLDEGHAVVTRRLIQGKALDTLPFHVFPKSIEKSAIVLLDQRTKLVPTNRAHAGLDLIECCVQGFSDGSVSPFVRLRSFAVGNRKTNGPGLKCPPKDLIPKPSIAMLFSQKLNEPSKCPCIC